MWERDRVQGGVKQKQDVGTARVTRRVKGARAAEGSYKSTTGAFDVPADRYSAIKFDKKLDHDVFWAW